MYHASPNQKKDEMAILTSEKVGIRAKQRILSEVKGIT